jgi:hypothetical protein
MSLCDESANGRGVSYGIERFKLSLGTRLTTFLTTTMIYTTISTLCYQRRPFSPGFVIF